MCVCREQTHTHTLISHDDYVLKIVFLLEFLFSSFAFIIYYSNSICHKTSNKIRKQKKCLKRKNRSKKAR